MGYSLWKFVILALAASSETVPGRPSIANQTFEVDVIFPRPGQVWQTYATREIQTFKANGLEGCQPEHHLGVVHLFPRCPELRTKQPA